MLHFVESTMPLHTRYFYEMVSFGNEERGGRHLEAVEAKEEGKNTIKVYVILRRQHCRRSITQV